MLTNKEMRDYHSFGKRSTQLAVCLLIMTLSSVGFCQEPIKASSEILEAFGLSKAQVVQLDPNFVAGQPLIEPVLIDGKEYVFELFPRSIRAATHILKEQLADGSFRFVDPGAPRTFKGSLRGSKGSRVVGSMTDHGFGGKIIMGDGLTMYIEPVMSRLGDPALEGTHVIYSALDTAPTDAVCGVGLGRVPFDQVRRNNLRRQELEWGQTALGTGGLSVCEVGVDADFEFFMATF